MFKIITLTLVLASVAFVAAAQTSATADELVKSSAAHIQRHELEAALIDANKAIQMEPRNVNALYLRSMVETVQGDTAAAAADYDLIIQLAPNTKGIDVIYNNRAYIRTTNGDLKGALSDLDHAVSINPQNAMAYNSRAVVKGQINDPTGALADYERAIEINPLMTPAYVGRAYFRWQNGDLDGALADYNKVVELAPQDGMAWTDRGIIRGLKGNIDLALDDLRKGINLDPQSIVENGKGNFTTPFMDLNEFVRTHPESGRAREVRGIFRLMQGKEAEADADFKRSVELDPNLKKEIEGILTSFKNSKPAN